VSAKASDVAQTMREATLRRRAAAALPPPALDAAGAVAPAPTKSPASEIRYALRLPPALHRFVRQFALDHGVDASEVTRALYRELERDPALADRVLDAIRGEEVPR
jgi:hypothetical protein